MKISRLSATLLLLGSLTLGLADDTSASTSVNEQITAIQNASSVEERKSLVNEFKTTLLTLDSKERAVAVEQFQNAMQENSAMMIQTQIKTQARVQSRATNMTNQAMNTQMMDTQMMAAPNAISQSFTPTSAAAAPTQMVSNMQGGFMGRK
jgi:hypothetical protein